MPVRETVCGLPAALSVMLRDAERVPAAVGLNVTLTVQLLPAARLARQVWVWEKSPLFVPVTAMPLMVSVAVPVLVRVTVCGALPVPTC